MVKCVSHSTNGRTTLSDDDYYYVVSVGFDGFTSTYMCICFSYVNLFRRALRIADPKQMEKSEFVN